MQSFLNLRPYDFLRDIKSLPVEKYDLILNDFEPVTAWACKIKGKECTSLSHQCSFLSPKVPRPENRDLFAEAILKYYAPATRHVGFHFKKYDDFIHTPVIRKEVRKMKPSDMGHYTVYLPAYDDRFLVTVLEKIPEAVWHVFSKHTKRAYHKGNIAVKPVSNEEYNQSLESCTGLLTGGGFEAPAEAMFLGKKIMAVPMKGQYEQQCNAKALTEIGGASISRISEGTFPDLLKWVNEAKPVHINFPDNSSDVIAKVMSM
jgi:uncharacterized protein (TIGR00661 family)